MDKKLISKYSHWRLQLLCISVVSMFSKGNSDGKIISTFLMLHHWVEESVVKLSSREIHVYIQVVGHFIHP